MNWYIITVCNSITVTQSAVVTITRPFHYKNLCPFSLNLFPFVCCWYIHPKFYYPLLPLQLSTYILQRLLKFIFHVFIALPFWFFISLHTKLAAPCPLSAVNPASVLYLPVTPDPVAPSPSLIYYDISWTYSFPLVYIYY